MYTTRNKNNIIRTNIIIIYTVLYTHVYSVQGHRITDRQKFRLSGYLFFYFFWFINTHYLFIFFILRFFFLIKYNPGASNKPHCMHSGRRPEVGPVQFIYIILQEKEDLFLKRSRLVDRTCYIVLYRYTKQ